MDFEEFEENEIPWKERLIVKLYIRSVSSKPKYFLVLEIIKEWIILAVMTSKDKWIFNKYTIAYEKQDSEFYGSLINYNAILVINKNYDMREICQTTFRGEK